MVQVYTYPERKEIFADDIEELKSKATELIENGFSAWTSPCKAMGTYRQSFIKKAETDQAQFPYVVEESED